MRHRISREEQGDDVALGVRERARQLQRAILRTGVLSVVGLDAVRVAIAYFAVLVLRFDGSVPTHQWQRFGRFLPIAIALHLIANWRSGLYEQVWRHASVDEAIRVVKASAATLGLLLVFDMVDTPRVPVSVVVFGALVAMLLTGASRFQTRLLTALNRTRRRTGGTPVAIIGDGEATAMLIRAMRTDTGSLEPVAVLVEGCVDRGSALLGVPVLGDIDDLPRLTQKLGIVYALLPTDDLSRETMLRAVDAAEASGIALKIVPDLGEVIRSSQLLRTMRNVRIEDLLGREQVTTDLEAVRRTVSRRRVLITGAGGSIGSEIARQVAAMDPAELLLLDHDETHLFEVANGVPMNAVSLLADIRDRDVIDELFERHRPEVVFHAAAHKHVPILEAHACEAVRTNVNGTHNVLRAAAEQRVERLVFVSTDKAVDPSNVMGASKWLGERLVQMLAPRGAHWCAVRFGNVLGSRGSVIPAFERQIEAGGPVTVTDPRMTRYFMSTSEAVQLVLQSATFADGGDIFLLEMGEPVNILELARKMIRLSGLAPGTDIAVEITGTRPGEKLVEQLASDDERLLATPHQAIHRLVAEAFDESEVANAVEKLRELAKERDDTAAASLLLELPKRVAMHTEHDRQAVAWSPATT